MIVRKIRVARFGRFVEPFEAELCPDHMNLLDGANGSGKSTLLAALTSVFTLPATSTAQEIRRWKPWGRELEPWVAVEFEHEGGQWRLTKEFRLSPRGRAVLEKLQDDRWEMVAEGKHVEERLPEFLGGQSNNAGSWLVAGVLWARQNQLSEIVLDSPVQERIRQSLGTQIRSGAVERVLREAGSRCAENWTPTGRQKQNAPVRQQETRLDGLRRELDGIRKRLEELDRDRKELENLNSEAARLDDVRSRLQQRAGELREQSRKKSELEARRLAAEKALQEARFARQTAEDLLSQRGKIGGELQSAKERLDGLGGRLEQARAAVRNAEDALVRARSGIAERMAELEAELKRLNAPPPETLKDLVSLDQQARELEAKLEGALLHARLELDRDARLEVLRGTPAGALEGRAGESLEIAGSPEIELVVPDLGRLRIWGPAESAADLQARIADVRGRRQRLAAEWGGEAVESLEAKRSRADGIEHELGVLRGMRQQHESGNSVEALQLRQARKEAENLEAELRGAQDALRRLEEQRQRLETDPRNEEALRAASREAALRIDVEQQRLEEVRGELRSLPGDLEELLVRCEDELDQANRQLELSREKANVLRGRIEQRQGEGLYAEMARREESLAAAEEEFRALRLGTRADKLLWDTLDAVLKDAERQILPHVERRTVELLERISGAFLQQVVLDAGSWVPAAVRPAEAGEAVAPDRISGGEQEQLYLALRLALADILTENEPHLVVLDDVLLATDSRRLERILELIEERRRRMQFLILTCHPERFRELSGARLIRLGGQEAYGSV